MEVKVKERQLLSAQSPKLEIIRSTSSPTIAPKGVIVAISGLNATFEVMRPLLRRLAAKGYTSIQGLLPGDEGPTLDANPQTWKNCFLPLIEKARQEFPGTPMVALGYSAGGLALAAALKQDSTIVKRSIFLAPAVSFTLPVWALRTVFLPLELGRAWGFSIPSSAPKHIRQNPRVYLQSYAALFQLASDVSRARLNSEAGQSLVIVAPDDELVKSSGIKRWANRNLSGATVEILPAAPAAKYPRHLFIRPEYAGEDRLERVVDTIEKFLAKSL